MSRKIMRTGADEIVHTIRTWATATEAYRSKALRHALFDGSLAMGDVLISLHGQEHRDRRRIENPLFRHDVLLAYEREEFPAVLSATLQPPLTEGRCELLGFGHQVMLNLSCLNAGIDRQLGDTTETERLLGLLALFIDGARIHHYQGDRDAKVAEISQALETFDAEFVAASLRRRQQVLADGNEVPRDVCGVLATHTDVPRGRCCVGGSGRMTRHWRPFVWSRSLRRVRRTRPLLGAGRSGLRLRVRSGPGEGSG